MTCSSCPFPSPSRGKRSWDRGKQHGAEGREGETSEQLIYIFIQTYEEDSETCTRIFVQPLPLGPPSTRMVSFPCPQSLSQLLSHSWLFFIWGSGLVRGGEGVLPNLRSQLSSRC